MNVDVATLTAVTSGLLAAGTTAVAYLRRSDDKVGKRIDQALDANQELVHNLQSERNDLLGRIDTLLQRVAALEIDRDTLTREVARLREEIAAQAREVMALRAQESELRDWATNVITPWVLRARDVIRNLGGEIEQPPPAPARRDF